MKMLMQMVLACALAIVCVITTGHEVTNTPSLHDTKSDTDREGRFFFKHSSTTRVTLVTVTRPVFSTCYSVSTGTVAATIGPCNGRRKRRSVVKTIAINENALPSIATQLESSSASEDDTGKRSGKLLTFWTTNYSTLTVTTKSFIPGTTVTVSIKCTIPGVLTEDSCGFLHFD